MDKLIKLSKASFWAAAFSAFLVTAIYFFLLLDGSISGIYIEKLIPEGFEVSGSVSIMTIFVFTFPPILIYVLCVVCLMRILYDFSLGKIFTNKTCVALKFLGFLICLLPVVQLIAEVAVSYVLTSGNGAGKRFIGIDVSLSELILMIFGLFAVIFGVILAEAVKIKSENDQII